MARASWITESGRRYPLPLMALVGLVAGLFLQFALGASHTASVVFGATLGIGGLTVVSGTLRGMLHGQFASDIVASLAIVGAAATQEWLAGCVIVLMQTGGEALEDFAVQRASKSLEQLLARAPRIARVKRESGFDQVPVEEVAPDDVLLVRPGDIIPVDAVILSGMSALDESSISGESLPVDRKPGDEVMSGCVSLTGALEVRAIRPSSESQFEQILRLVREAQEDKPPIGRLADRYAVVFTPITLLLCVLAYLVTRTPEAVVAVLVVATPCPLILATPVAIISGINRAASRGIVVKGGTSIEQAGGVRAVVFDKTGTLTRGTPVVRAVEPLREIPPGRILNLAAALEQHSDHPMAHALVTAGSSSENPLSLPEQVVEIPGRGVSGIVDGKRVSVGSLLHAIEEGVLASDQVEQLRQRWGADAVAVVSVNGIATGIVVFDDPPRGNTHSMLKRLKDLGIRDSAMLTGDDEATARVIADGIGIEDVRAELLPAQKVAAVREIGQRYGSVMMVGDGINDAPALAAATVGVALAHHGVAAAAEAADIVITSDDIGRVADVIEIGRRTLYIAKQSIWAGLGMSGAMMLVAAFGYIPPTVGALLQEVVDTAVILNALRAR